MQSRGEWGHWSPLAHLGWLLSSLPIVDLEPIMVPASFLLPESLTTSLLANSTQNHTEKRILGKDLADSRDSSSSGWCKVILSKAAG